MIITEEYKNDIINVAEKYSVTYKNSNLNKGKIVLLYKQCEIIFEMKRDGIDLKVFSPHDDVLGRDYIQCETIKKTTDLDQLMKNIKASIELYFKEEKLNAYFSSINIVN